MDKQGEKRQQASFHKAVHSGMAAIKKLPGCDRAALKKFKQDITAPLQFLLPAHLLPSSVLLLHRSPPAVF